MELSFSYTETVPSMVNLKIHKIPQKNPRWMEKTQPHTITLTILAFNNLWENSHLMKIKKTGMYVSQFEAIISFSIIEG